MRLPTRRTFWLSAILLLSLCVTSAFLVVVWPLGIHAKFDRIEEGMSIGEVTAILGKPDFKDMELFNDWECERVYLWKDTPRWDIVVEFNNDDKVSRKKLFLMTTGELLKWYVEQVAQKLGMGL